jgi:uncharacterized protein YjbI with pentapeptide repeats
MLVKNFFVDNTILLKKKEKIFFYPYFKIYAVIHTAFTGVTFTGVTFNGVTFNGVMFNGVTFNGVTFNGIM